MAKGGLIHVGAGDGIEYRGSRRKRLLLIEPLHGPFIRLRRNLEGREGVELVQVACAARAGERRVYVAKPQACSSLIKPKGLAMMGVETVRVVTLDQIVAGREFAELVIDVQGAELDVLRGATATLTHVQRIEVEIHKRKTYPGAASRTQVSKLLAPAFRFVEMLERTDGGDPGALYERA